MHLRTGKRTVRDTLEGARLSNVARGWRTVPANERPTLIDVIRRLFPNGTVPHHSSSLRRLFVRPRWDRCPPWPPDLFAVTATLVDRSGCYSDRARGTYLEEVKELGAEWRWRTDLWRVPVGVQQLWGRLVERFGQSPVTRTNGHERRESWWPMALKLMAIADEASAGIGFMNPREDSEFTLTVFQDHFRFAVGEERQYLKWLPQSLCLMVPPSELCVQPKSRTPQVGYTLRSLSHNLALLPSVGEVRTEWRLAAWESVETTKPLNLLLVPYPYRVEGTCFRGK